MGMCANIGECWWSGTRLGIEGKFANVSPESIVILEFPAEETQIKLVAEFLKFKEKTGNHGLYVSSNRSTNNLVEKLNDYGHYLQKMVCAYI